MHLYLLSNDTVLLEHLERALVSYCPKPLSLSSLDTCKEEDIVFTSELELPVEFFKQCKVFILSRLPDFEESQDYLKKGAMGYANALMHESHFESVIHTLQEDKVWLYPDFVTRLITQIHLNGNEKQAPLDQLNRLSPREKEVALLLIEGKSQIEISEELSITIRTVKAHSTSIYEKLNVKDRLALTILFHP